MDNAEEVKARALALMGEMSPEDRKIIEAHLSGKGGKSKRMSEEEILLKRPHAIAGTLRYNPVSRKQEMDFTCQQPGCETVGTCATSDLFQVKFCEPHKADAVKAKKAADAERIKAILELHPELKSVKLPKKS